MAAIITAAHAVMPPPGLAPRKHDLSAAHVGKRSQPKSQHLSIDMAQLQAIVARAQRGPLSAEDAATLSASLQTLAFLQQELKSKGASIKRLRQIVFGSSTEKTQAVLGKSDDEARTPNGSSNTNASEKTGDTEKAKGHGRNSASAYSGANKVAVQHASLNAGQQCQGCQSGKLYPVKEPAQLVRITGMAPLSATIYECEKLRCNACGEVHTAPAPEGVGDEKYDETSIAMVGLLKYGTGLPFNRIEKLQEGMGIPLPAATQWGLVKNGAEELTPAHEELIRQGAQGRVLHNDDTTMKVLELTKEQRAAAATDNSGDERTGVFTSGIISVSDEHKVALFFTGANHAGENLSDVLRRRAVDTKPIQMCDALSRNTSSKDAFDTLLANCLAHSRRKYVEVADDFPDECRFVLETLREVYGNDALAREQQLSDEERLRLHQRDSAPLMMKLEAWMKQQLDEHKVEPNSTLGDAIGYMRKHWSKLTLFLRAPGAPLDNNICERALKKVILHRKNALFYRTLNGARVGDVFMSLIHSAELNAVQPFDYLVALLRNADKVNAAPAEWMPWNYAAALARVSSAAEAPT